MNSPSALATWLLTASIALTGCAQFGAFGAGFTNPRAFQLANDGSPLTVVVQRADAATTTAEQVDRLLTSTPIDDDAAWVSQTELPNNVVTARKKDLASHPYYDGKKYDIVDALIWAERLAEVKSVTGTHPSLLAAISPELGAGYRELQGATGRVAELEASIQREVDAGNEVDCPPADKVAHEANKNALAKELDDAKGVVEAKREAFVAQAKTSASMASPAACAHFEAPIASLLRAVQAAQTSNGAAALRYPTVAVSGITTIHSQLLDVIKGNVSDYIFERTGKRVTLRGFHPVAKFENGRVTLGINEIAPEDLGQLEPVGLVAETTARTQNFVTHALKLLATVGTTHDTLSFQESVLQGVRDGIAIARELHAQGSTRERPNRVALSKGRELGESVSAGKVEPPELGRATQSQERSDRPVAAPPTAVAVMAPPSQTAARATGPAVPRLPPPAVVQPQVAVAPRPPAPIAASERPAATLSQPSAVREAVQRLPVAPQPPLTIAPKSGEVAPVETLGIYLVPRVDSSNTESRAAGVVRSSTP